MKWKQERDLLIAQTMAFAQSITGKPADIDGWFEPGPVQAPAEAAPPVEVYPVAHASARYTSLREEIRGRVAAFRTHQELLRRDRDEYYNSVLARVRPSAEHGREAPDNPPVKR